jgi:hypothetical protein
MFLTLELDSHTKTRDCVSCWLVQIIALIADDDSHHVLILLHHSYNQAVSTNGFHIAILPRVYKASVPLILFLSPHTLLQIGVGLKCAASLLHGVCETGEI